MKRVLLVLVFVAGLPDSGVAQPQTDGNTWNSVNEEFKIGYAVGFLQGVRFGEDLIVVGFASVGAEALTLFTSQKLYAAYLRAHFSQMSAGQVVDGLNSFYGDYRNRSIELPNAVWVIAHEIVGTPRAEVEIMIENLRRNYVQEPKH